MSDAIYDDVIKVEEMKRERGDMTVDIYESADCVRDHDFTTKTNTLQPLQHTGSDSVKSRSSRAAVVCLVLLCVLLLTAVIVLCVHIHTINTNYTKETHRQLTKITSLTEERDQSNQEKSEMFKSLREMDGQIYQSSFYFVSSEWNNWTESRRYCTERGADLTIINNRKEHEFIQKISGSAGVWIGLTDIDVENTWKWVDGITLTSGFWRTSEPNGQRGENCVASYPKGWYDYPCSNAFKWICEKNFKNE